MFNGKTHYKLPFSIAMLNYQRVSHRKISTCFLDSHKFHRKIRTRAVWDGRSWTAYFHGSVEWVFPLPPGQPWNIAMSCRMSCHWMGVITGCGAADLLRKTTHRFLHIFAIRRPKLLLFVESTVVKIRVLLYFLNFSQFSQHFPRFFLHLSQDFLVDTKPRPWWPTRAWCRPSTKPRYGSLYWDSSWASGDWMGDLPSGNLLHSYWTWPSRNSWFTRMLCSSKTLMGFLMGFNGVQWDL